MADFFDSWLKNSSYTSNYGTDWDSLFPEPTTDELTLRQALIKMEALKRRNRGGVGNFLKDVGRGALGPVSWTLDKIMRPSWAVTAGVNAAIESGGDPGEIAKHMAKGLAAREKIGFGEILYEHAGLSKRWAGLAGFPLDVVTDPLMAVSVAAAPVTGGGSLAAYAVMKGAGRAASKELIEKAAQEAGRRVLRGETDDILGQALQEGGRKYQHRFGAWKLQKDQKLLEAENALPGIAREANMTISMAAAEARQFDPYYLGLRIGTAKHGALIPKLRVPVIRAPGEKIAAKGLPIISQLFDMGGRYFSPGYEKRILHEGEMIRQHAAKYNQTVMVAELEKRFAGISNKLTPEQKLHAVDLFESPLKTTRGGRWNAVLKAKADSPFETRLNERYIKFLQQSGKITDDEVAFVRAVHETTEQMFLYDKMAGVLVEHYTKRNPGRLYVPHYWDDQSAKIIQKGLLTNAAYVNRRTNPLSILANHKLALAGKMPPIETDIEKALVKRARSGAEQQADQSLINSIKAAVGKPTRVVDKAKLARATTRLTKLQDREAELQRAVAEAEQGYQFAIEDAIAQARSVHKASRREVDKQIKAARDKHKMEGIRRLEHKRQLPNRRLAQAEKAVQTVAQLRKQKASAQKFVELLPKREQKKVQKLTAAQKKDYVENYFATLVKDRRARIRAGLPADEIAAIQKEIERLQRGRFNTPEIQALKEEQAHLDSEIERIIGLLTNKNSKLHQEALGNAYKTLKQTEAAHKRTKREIRAKMQAIAKIQKGKPNPELEGLNFVEIANQRVVDEFGNAYAFPPEYAEPLARYERLVAGDPTEMDKFLTGVAKWVGGWKVLVTVVNPGYRIRNTMTDFWNMWIAGVPAHAIGTYSVKAARIIGAAKKGDPEALRIIQEASETGIFAGLYAGDIQKAAKFVRGERVTLREAPIQGIPVVKVLQTFNKNVENWGRLTHYLYRRQGLKETIPEAAKKVKLAHFDYEELTSFEEKLKLVFPFYTWTRKNIPYQVKQLFANPGRYAAFPKFIQEMQFAAGDPDKPISDWVREGYGVSLPFGKDLYYMPQFGVSDLQAVDSFAGPTNRMTGLLGPHIKVPMELAFGKNLFTGQPIVPERHPLVPASSFAEQTLGRIPGNPFGIGTTSRTGPGGKQISGPGMSPKAAYFLGQVPLLRSAFISGAGSIPSKSAGAGIPPSWWSTLAGQSIARQDPALINMITKFDIEDSVDKVLTGLRDSGNLRRKKRKKTDFDKMIERILNADYKGGG